MPGCIFHVSGETFEADAFLANSTLKPYRFYHRGEISRRGRVIEDNGFCLDVSKADGVIKAQVADVISFLATHEAELQRLRDFPGVTDMRLDFGHFFREVPAQHDYLPPELLARAGNLGIGIALSLYVSSDREPTVGS